MGDEGYLGQVHVPVDVGVGTFEIEDVHLSTVDGSSLLEFVVESLLLDGTKPHGHDGVEFHQRFGSLVSWNGDEHVYVVGYPVQVPLVLDHVIDSDAHRSCYSGRAGSGKGLEESLDALTEDSCDGSFPSPLAGSEGAIFAREAAAPIIEIAPARFLGEPAGLLRWRVSHDGVPLWLASVIDGGGSHSFFFYGGVGVVGRGRFDGEASPQAEEQLAEGFDVVRTPPSGA